MLSSGVSICSSRKLNGFRGLMYSAFFPSDSVLLGVIYKNIHELFLTELNKDNMTKQNRFVIKTALAYKIIAYDG